MRVAVWVGGAILVVKDDFPSFLMQTPINQPQFYWTQCCLNFAAEKVHYSKVIFNVHSRQDKHRTVVNSWGKVFKAKMVTCWCFFEVIIYYYEYTFYFIPPCLPPFGLAVNLILPNMQMWLKLPLDGCDISFLCKKWLLFPFPPVNPHIIWLFTLLM